MYLVLKQATQWKLQQMQNLTETVSGVITSSDVAHSPVIEEMDDMHLINNASKSKPLLYLNLKPLFD